MPTPFIKSHNGVNKQIISFGFVYDPDAVINGISGAFRLLWKQVVHKDFSFSVAITGQDVWIPMTDHRFAVTDLNFSVAGANNVNISFYDGSNVAGARISQLVVQPPTNSTSFFPIRFSIPYVSTGLNSRLRVSATNSINIAGVVHEYEIPEWVQLINRLCF